MRTEHQERISAAIKRWWRRRKAMASNAPTPTDAESGGAHGEDACFSWSDMASLHAEIEDLTRALATAQERAEAAEREMRKWHKVAMDAGVVVCSDGGFIFAETAARKTASALAEQMVRERDEAREALKPFAQAAEIIPADMPDDTPAGFWPATVGDFRRATLNGAKP